MRLLAVVFNSITIFSLFSQSLCAQSYPTLLTYNETNVNHGNVSASVLRARSENEIYLEIFFSPDTIPTSGIPVLENALGDIVNDNMINLLDLLRLRDIIIGRPPLPSTYENEKGDLTQDGIINSQDLNFIRDILLHKSSVPYIIGSNGGQVLGDGIELTIPPGALDTTITISVKRYSESEFTKNFDVDIEGALQDSAYFMTSFEITSSTADFKLPYGATIKLDSIPPCAYQGLNGLFAAVSDRDGDGRAELFMINELQLNGDSLTLTTADLPIPKIQSISNFSVEPGQLLTIKGSGFENDPQNIVIRFISTISPESSGVTTPSFIINDTIIVVVPGEPLGQVMVELYSLQTGITSNAMPLNIVPISPITEDIRSIIVGFLQGMITSLDSAHLDKWFVSIEDTTVRNFILNECQNNRSSLNEDIDYFITLPDSLLQDYEPIASFIINQSEAYSQLALQKQLLKVSVSSIGPCADGIIQEYKDVENSLRKLYQIRKELYNFFVRQCFLDKPGGKCAACESAEGYRKFVLEITDLLADLFNMMGDRICRECPGEIECDKCKKTVSVGFGPKGKVTGAFDENGFWKTTGVCTNIKKYKRNECIGVLRPVTTSKNSPVPIQKPSFLECPSNFNSISNASTNMLLIDNPHPHPGSIIKITNAPVSYNMVGILNDNGKAFIPSVPFNTKVTFSIYDPVTGLYDPDAGTYTTGSEPGGFDRPMLLFQPKTDIRRIAMHIGEIKRDSVSLNWQRIDYILNVTSADLGKLINVGFEANALLSVRLIDPQSNIIMDNNNTDCYFYPRIRLNQIGTYTLRVAYGVSGQAGSFAVGVDYYPNSPIGIYFNLCGGLVVDTLYEILSPYLVEDPLTVNSGDTVVVEAGVNLLFDQGGSITSNGTFVGNGSQEKPIKLKHFEATNQKSIMIKEKLSDRKEIKP